MPRNGIAPAEGLVIGRLDRRDAPQQRRLRLRAIGDMADTRGVVPRQLQRMVFVIVPSPQVGALRVFFGQFQSVDIRKEPQAVIIPIGIKFHMPQVGDVVTWVGHRLSTVRGKIDWKPSAYLQSRPPDCPPELRLKWLARCWATRV
mgnify:CR=1 FL=1